MDSAEVPMIRVAAGAITLRDARRGTSRDVDLVAFDLGATPVTRAWSSEVLQEAPPPRQDARVPVHSVSWLEAVTWCNAASAVHGLVPAYAVEGDEVTWDTASSGFRLPTDAEWEHACRAGTTGPRYGDLAEIAWTAADAVEAAQPVGGRHSNDWGLSDMLGNVWEWCWDRLDPARYADYRVLRGGGWADQHWNVRASARRGSMPQARLDDLGFRVARGAAPDGQGWSLAADRERAHLAGPTPAGWTRLRP